MNEEKIIKELKYNIPEDYIRSCDTSDGIGKYEIDTDSWQYQLYVYVLKLQNNWNELKKSIENDIKEYEESEFHIKEPPISIQTKINILIQMQEMENSNNGI